MLPNDIRGLDSLALRFPLSLGRIDDAPVDIGGFKRHARARVAERHPWIQAPYVSFPDVARPHRRARRHRRIYEAWVPGVARVHLERCRSRRPRKSRQRTTLQNARLPVTGGPPCDLAPSSRTPLFRASSQGFSPPLTGFALARDAPVSDLHLVLVSEGDRRER